jgi:hypothetical protein
MTALPMMMMMMMTMSLRKQRISKYLPRQYSTYEGFPTLKFWNSITKCPGILECKRTIHITIYKETYRQ